MNYIIFDDAERNGFFPLTLNRSTGDLRVGILKLRQRLFTDFDMDDMNILIHSDLKDIYEERHPEWNINSFSAGDYIFVNSRLKINPELVEKIKNLQSCTGIRHRDIIAAVRMKFDGGEISSECFDYDNIEWIDTDDEKIGFWGNIPDFVKENAEYIERDFKAYFYEKDNYFETEMGVMVMNPYNIWLGEGCRIQPGVVIDATEGPVVIDEDAQIMANSVIIGPVYIGKKTKIKAMAKIYEGTTIGPVCKIGGEIEESIIHGYSNKQHDGFLGHAYLGEWVNLGADTNNSDLKNNYGNVKIYSYKTSSMLDSGTQFMGSIIGDHTKIGINCSLNTGVVIGMGCNLYGRELISGFIKDFSWGEADKLTEYRPDKFFATASIVKQRRNLEFSETEKVLYNKLVKKGL